MSFILISLAAWGIGSRCLRSVAFVDAVESLTLRCLVGLIPVATLALLVGSYSLQAAQVTLAILAVFSILLHRKMTPAPAPSPRATPLNWLEKCCLATLLCAWGLSLLGALAPVTNWDACVAHLALPADYTRVGHLYLHPGNVYSGYPHFMHTLYAVAFYGGSGGHELPVSFFNWALAVLATLAIYSLGRRIGTRQTGLVAAALLSTAPIYMDQATGVGIDLPFAAFSTASLAALMAWHKDKHWGWLAIAAVLAGGACGIRHTGYLVTFLCMMAIPFHGPKGHRVRAGLFFAAIALAVATPWFGRSWLLTGNPLFPFLLTYFPPSPIDHIAITAPGVHESIERSRGISLWALARFPWDIIMRPQDYDGWAKSPGGLVLILGLPGLLLGGSRARWLGAYSASGSLVFFFFQRLARYILPFFTPMMVVAALVPERIPRGRRLVTGILCLSFAYGLALHAAAMHFKIGVLLGRQNKQEYLEDRVERYGAFRYANEQLNDGGTMLLLDQRSYYVDGPTYQNHWSLQRIAAEPLEAQIAWLHDKHIRYVMIPVEYVRSSGALSGRIADMLEGWQAASAYFEPLGTPLQLPQRDGRGLEEVIFYRVREAGTSPDQSTR